MKNVSYDWSAEEVAGSMLAALQGQDAEITAWNYPTAAEMIAHMVRHELDPAVAHYRPCVVRDRYQGGDLVCRSWAYLHRREDGKFYLPDDFLDAMGAAVCPVPLHLRKILELAQAAGTAPGAGDVCADLEAYARKLRDQEAQIEARAARVRAQGMGAKAGSARAKGLDLIEAWLCDNVDQESTIYFDNGGTIGSAELLALLFPEKYGHGA